MHREAVLALLADYSRNELCSEEREAVRETVNLVRTHEDCLLRTCMPGHVTGSAWILSPDSRRTLLTLHRKLGRWLQLGGHADGDPDILAVAMREAREESGLKGLRARSAAVFDVDRHWIPARGAEAGHWHHDLRFVIEADPAETLVVSSESKELAWVELSAVGALNPSESLARMVRKSDPGA